MARACVYFESRADRFLDGLAMSSMGHCPGLGIVKSGLEFGLCSSVVLWTGQIPQTSLSLLKIGAITGTLLGGWGSSPACVAQILSKFSWVAPASG